MAYQATCLHATHARPGPVIWYAENPGTTNGGNLVTAGNVVCQGGGTGDFYAFDAQSGERLFTHSAESSIHASPLTYQVNGTQYVAIVATYTIHVFSLAVGPAQE